MSARTATLGRLKLVGASAGSGKTHRLTEEVKRAVDPESDDHVALEGLVAVTYTRRAAAELAARMRQSLIEAGAAASAQRLPLAYLGTVHAVCLRLVQELAIDAGLSPRVEVFAGDAARLWPRRWKRKMPVGCTNDWARRRPRCGPLGLENPADRLAAAGQGR